MRSDSASRNAAILTAVLLLSMTAACGAAKASSTTPTPSPTAPASPSPSAASAVAPFTPVATAGWVSYASAVNHVTFRHPADMKPLECGWVYIAPNNPTSCPLGDGFCCIFFRSSDNGETGTMSLISTNLSLYTGGVQRTSVTVDGVTGTRLSGTQTFGMGVGPQVEYDFKTGGRTYNLFAYAGGQSDSLDPVAPSAAVFDQIVRTATFTR